MSALENYLYLAVCPYAKHYPDYQRWFDVKKLSRTYLIASLTLPNITKVIIFYQSINIHYIIITTLLTQPKIGSPVVP